MATLPIVPPHCHKKMFLPLEVTSDIAYTVESNSTSKVHPSIFRTQCRVAESLDPIPWYTGYKEGYTLDRVANDCRAYSHAPFHAQSHRPIYAQQIFYRCLSTYNEEDRDKN